MFGILGIEVATSGIWGELPPDPDTDLTCVLRGDDVGKGGGVSFFPRPFRRGWRGDEGRELRFTGGGVFIPRRSNFFRRTGSGGVSAPDGAT